MSVPGAVCLRAPLRRCEHGWHRSWYDCERPRARRVSFRPLPNPPPWSPPADYTDCSGCMEHDRIDEPQFWDQVRRVHAALDTLPPSTVLSGESQGGTVALWAALTYTVRPVRVLAIRTVLLPLTPPPHLERGYPSIRVFAARDDEVFPLALQRESLSAIPCSWHVHSRLTHSQPCAAIWKWMHKEPAAFG